MGSDAGKSQSAAAKRWLFRVKNGRPATASELKTRATSPNGKRLDQAILEKYRRAVWILGVRASTQRPGSATYGIVRAAKPGDHDTGIP